MGKKREVKTEKGNYRNTEGKEKKGKRRGEMNIENQCKQ